MLEQAIVTVFQLEALGVWVAAQILANGKPHA